MILTARAVDALYFLPLLLIEYSALYPGKLVVFISRFLVVLSLGYIASDSIVESTEMSFTDAPLRRDPIMLLMMSCLEASPVAGAAARSTD